MAPDAAPKPPPTLESEAITHRPPNQMGLPTPATIGNRMGNTFGTSAYPQRPLALRRAPAALSPGAR